MLFMFVSSIVWAPGRAQASESEPVESACSQAVAASPTSSAFAGPAAVPVLRTRVTDLPGALSKACKDELAARLHEIELKSGIQLAVLLVESTGSVSIEEYAVQVFAKSKLGQAGVDNGLLLVVALKDRRVRLEVGYGLEGTVTDVIAAHIIAYDIKPAFAANRFEAGLRDAVNDIAVTIGVNALRDAATGTASVGKPPMFPSLQVRISRTGKTNRNHRTLRFTT
ncbi:Beta-propeller domain of methanol dehydrogenase type [Candidatus Burkholderia verschuerenii]|uniref:Beta-propeller domain of methanol dehydrogenase type n=1 Tax=Candidatus Burkholderia verschuerenii TaxID=242163 RepID=A0A0L0M6Y4_9BURK|nr:TPM domain-containing protein [Candidatus Burkholderia verschuerenii]KND58427.1 Beta-propeller domain of methanol dehydrogenase type [Candidatus Burkholderia verschuerenii]